MTFPWEWKPGGFPQVIWPHSTVYVIQMLAHTELSEKVSLSLSLTQTAVVLQELSSVIPGKISVAKKWWADWHLSAGSWFNTLAVVSHFEETSGKHMGFVCVCTCLSWISAVKSLALWRANHLILTLSCYFKAFSWPAQRKFQQVPIVLLARAPSEGMLVGSFFFAVGWPATGTLGFQAWLKAQPFWGRVLVYKIR